MAAETNECNGVKGDECRVESVADLTGTNGVVRSDRDDSDGSYVFVDGGESDEVLVEGTARVGDGGFKSGDVESAQVPENAGGFLEVRVVEGNSGELCKENGRGSGTIVALNSGSLEVMDGKECGGDVVVEIQPKSELDVSDEVEKSVSVENSIKHEGIPANDVSSETIDGCEKEQCAEVEKSVSVEDSIKHEGISANDVSSETIDGCEKEQCAEEVENWVVGVGNGNGHEDITGSGACSETLDGCEKKQHLEERPVSEVLNPSETSESTEEVCGNGELDKNEGHDQDGSMEVTSGINCEEQTESDLAVQVPIKADSKGENDVNMDECEEESNGSKLEEQLTLERSMEVMEVSESLHAIYNGGPIVFEGRDVEDLSVEMTNGVVAKQTDVDSVPVLAESDVKEDPDATVVDVVGSESLVPEIEKQMLKSLESSHVQETIHDLDLNSESRSQEESEIAKIESEKHSETVPTSTSECAKSVVDVCTGPSESLSSYLASGDMNGDGFLNRADNSIEGIKLENQVPCSEMLHDICSEPAQHDENVLSDHPREVALEINSENIPIDSSISAEINSSTKKELENEAPPGVFENIDNFSACGADELDSEKMAEPVSAEEAELKYLTTQAMIVRWEGEASCDEVEISSDKTQNIASSPDDDDEQKHEDGQAKVETSKDSSANHPEPINKKDEFAEGTPESEVLPPTWGDASSSPLNGPSGGSDFKQLLCYMIKLPKFFDDHLMAQKEVLELQVDEKTRSRDSIKLTLQNKMTTRNEIMREVDAARKEEKAARDLFNAKRLEIDAIQLTISKMKNATSIDEIDDKINNLEHRIQHETISLKEEKQLLREIKSLKQSREQLCSSLGSQTEVIDAFDQKDQIEEQFQLLKKELSSLRGDLLRAEMNTKVIKKKYEDECQSIRDLNAKRNAANDLRQETYSHLWSVKKEYLEKNAHFYQYKDDRRAADNLATSGDKEALQRHCSNQVEKIMELWNNNVEFRNQYIKFNTNSTVRRFKTLDGRSLGQDEEPALLPNVRGYRQRSASVPSSKGGTQIHSETKQDKPSDQVTPEKVDQPLPNKISQKSLPNRPQKLQKSVPEETTTATASTEELIVDAEKKKKRIEEDELAKKAKELAQHEEELRKEKAAAQLKEKSRLEQIAKAKEAEDRKRRKAEKAKAKAEFRAQKEAELKEKKKAKKESRKEKVARTTNPESADNEAESLPELGTSSLPETAEESGVKAATPSKRPSRTLAAAKQSNKPKPLPLPLLRNKGKRKIQTWMWVLLAVVIILLVFLASSYIAFSKFNLPNFGF